ncbi:hypothetical protein Golob_023418 [Gossypium lobatum]|uniref:Protein-S-isoprenylcysteine O-methyltransferase n=1 Tax=Gossypium lobatum TaxID=34289 RepID=A0A7J8LJK6_9ROSI|nr:hypothetical protein [Gossypium lobatum]
MVYIVFTSIRLVKQALLSNLLLLLSVFTWLTLVPPVYFNGYLEDYYARPHDPKWDVNPPKWYRLLYCVEVMVGNWFAAFEALELHRIPGNWSNVGVWILIVATLLIQYSSTVYLAKYSEKVVVPTVVVQFGLYRWIRHPIYASTMLLFATYCIALRAPLILIFVVVVCSMYYDQKANLEESLFDVL